MYITIITENSSFRQDSRYFLVIILKESLVNFSHSNHPGSVETIEIYLEPVNVLYLGG